MKSLSYCFLHSQKGSLIAKQSKVSLIFSRKQDFSRAKGSCIVQLCPTNSVWFYKNNQNRCRFTLLKSWGHTSDWSLTCLLYNLSLCVQSLVPPDPMSQFHLKRGSPDEEFPDLCRNSTWMGRILTPAMYHRQFHRCTHSGVIFDDVIRPGLEEPGDVSTMSLFGWLSEKYSDWNQKETDRHSRNIHHLVWYQKLQIDSNMLKITKNLHFHFVSRISGCFSLLTNLLSSHSVSHFGSKATIM